MKTQREVLRNRIIQKLVRLKQELKSIPGEPCSGFLYHCSHPVEHERYFHLRQEVERVTQLLRHPSLRQP